MTTTPLSARPTSSPLGKCTEAVKTAVPFEFKQDLERHWRALGYGSESDFVREALFIVVKGKDYLTNLHASRIDSVARNLAGIGTETEGAGQ